jgi:malonate decarboxylase delta subunit
MESLNFTLPGQSVRQIDKPAVLAGVVSSGNLEVLIESAELAGACQVQIRTSAQGFAEIWSAVLEDFASRYDLANLRISVNDGGATPAVVSLRLDQAMENFIGVAP